MLKLQFRDRRREAVWLVDQVFTIGKDPSSSLMINDDSVLGLHAEITNKGDQISISNKASTPSLWVNNKLVENKTILKAEDIIKLGSVELELIDPKAQLNNANTQVSANKNLSNSWVIHSKASWLEQNIFPINNKVVIGRDPECDITLPLEHLSRKHLELELRSGHLFIKDLDSSNGTFLNGKRITSCEVKAGDKIKLDVLTFEVSGPAHDPNKTIIRTVPAPEKSTAQVKRPSVSTAKKQPVAKTTSPEKAKRLKKKQLAAKGKQDWISKDGQAGKVKKSNTGLIVLFISGFILCGVAGVFFMA